jgi:hypothetical protein
MRRTPPAVRSRAARPGSNAVTDIQDPSPGCRAQLLLGDLITVSGTLSEITTVWRRAKPYLPELPLYLPEQLQDAARQLAADVCVLTGADPVQPPDQALSLADRFCMLEQSIASARATTCGPGISEIGDSRLWESLSAPLRRAGTQLAALRPHPVTASG